MIFSAKLSCYATYILITQGQCIGKTNCGQPGLQTSTCCGVLAPCVHQGGLTISSIGVQGSYVPELLTFGTTHNGGMAFLAISPGGSTLEEDCSSEDLENARSALHKVHSCGVLHGDVSLRNFVRAPQEGNSSSLVNGSKIWVIDFTESSCAQQLSQRVKDEEIAQLNRSCSFS